jgi:hypothetical protein
MAVSDEQIPAAYKDTHRHYFGTLRKEIAKKGGAAAPSGPAPSAPTGNGASDKK